MNQRSRVLSEFNRIMFRHIFAHHPNCDLYYHHVYRIGSVRFCVGCTGLYSAFFISFLLDLVFKFSWALNLRFILGFLLFIPAINQLFRKSRKRYLKFIMRYSLGTSAYVLVSASLLVEGLYWKLALLTVFILATLFYSRKQGARQLIECEDCKYDQDYKNCNVRFADIKEINDLNLIFDVLSEDILNVIENK